MQATREQWNYLDKGKVWVGRYKNSHNLPHWHYDCELFTVERGAIDVFCNAPFTLTAGQSFFIDSEQVHYMHARDPETVIRMVVFGYDVIRSFASELSLISPVLSRTYDVAELYSSLMHIIGRKEKFYDYESAVKVMATMIEVFRNEPTQQKKKTERSADRFRSLLSEIGKNFEFYDLNAAAKFMAMNPAYFSRLFHKLTGMTFSQYLNYVRCENAIKLLHSDNELAVTDVAVRSGFNTIRNFNRIFKEFTGYTPKELPQNFILKENISNPNEVIANPTLLECELLESSNDCPPTSP